LNDDAPRIKTAEKQKKPKPCFFFLLLLLLLCSNKAL
jgi:hypothetical protein